MFFGSFCFHHLFFSFNCFELFHEFNVLFFQLLNFCSIVRKIKSSFSASWFFSFPFLHLPHQARFFPHCIALSPQQNSIYVQTVNYLCITWRDRDDINSGNYFIILVWGWSVLNNLFIPGNPALRLYILHVLFLKSGTKFSYYHDVAKFHEKSFYKK